MTGNRGEPCSHVRTVRPLLVDEGLLLLGWQQPLFHHRLSLQVSQKLATADVNATGIVFFFVCRLACGKLLSFEGLPVPNQLWTSARPQACLATRGSTSLKCSPGHFHFLVPQVNTFLFRRFNTYFRRTDGKYVAPAEALYVVTL